MENVMLNSIQTQIKIVDFGLSNMWSTENPLRTHCGSPEYAAPELFVTGKQYGTEVDLWSLGIILYGMVLGQLPFVTNRSDHVSSQERRKRLVSQINKGLSSSHRRSLANFTPEFRHLMNRLLIADSSKRMSVKELTVHPWITEKRKKLVRTHPLKPLDSYWHSKIISQIATLLYLDPNSVLTARTNDPLGKVGGMFNILVHKHQLNQLTGDGVSRTMPSLTLLELSDITKGTPKASPILKLPTVRNVLQKKPHTAVGTRRPDYGTPRVGLLTKISKPEVVLVNKTIKESTAAKIRPSTVHSTGQKSSRAPDYRAIKSPIQRRKAYSANITPKTTRPQSPDVGTGKPGPEKVPFRKVQERVTKDLAKKEIYELRLKDKEKGHLNEIRNSIMVLRTKPSTTPPIRQRETESRVHSAVQTATIAEKNRCKSEHVTIRKIPVAGYLTQALEKSIRKGRSGTVTVTQSASRTVEKPATAGPALSRGVRIKRELFDRHEHWERSPYAFGDSPVRAATAPLKQSGRKPAIYDPIARSIADYVVNNVPDKIHNFSWFRK